MVTTGSGFTEPCVIPSKFVAMTRLSFVMATTLCSHARARSFLATPTFFLFQKMCFAPRWKAVYSR